ncbi:MAG: carbohydrate-binding domain-containing protein [Muribaculaceae bacterium]|nr:carbohydrate-binding domain-containing protein [Muribaculaceae bacterium]
MSYKLWIYLFVALLCCGCVNDDTNFGGLVYDYTREELTPMAIALDFSPLDEPADVPPTDESDPYYSDYVENDTFDRTVYVQYDGNEVTLSGENERVQVYTDGAHVTISSQSSRMEYVLTGNSANGSLKIYSDHKYKLTLAGVTLTNPTGAPINNQCGKSLYLVLADGTTNTLADGPDYVVTEGEQMKGALFSEGQVIASGRGSLVVNATGGHGIASDDYIRFRPGCQIHVTANAGHGIKANDGIMIDGGVLNVEVTGDGFKGLKSDLGIEVRGGRTTVVTSGASRQNEDPVLGDSESDYSSCAGMKSDTDILISGGIVRVLSTGEGGKGLNAAGNLLIDGGSVAVVATGIKGNSSPKGIKSDSDITIAGGSTYAYSAAASPLDAAGVLTVADSCTVCEMHPRRVIVTFPE